MTIFNRIRTRLFALVLITVLPVLGLMYYTAAEQQKLDVARGQEDVLRLVRDAAGEQERMIEVTRQFLVIMAELPEIHSGDPVAGSRIMAGLLKRYPVYVNIGVIGINGELLCSAVPVSGTVNLSDRPYFQRAFRTRDFAIGDYQVGRTTGKPTLNLGYPVLDEAGQVKAVLFAAIDLNWLGQTASGANLPPGATLTVTDRNGTVLARYPDGEGFVGKTMPEVPAFQAILNKQGESAARITGADGTERLIAVKPLYRAAGGGEVYIFAGIPVNTFTADANRQLARNMAGLVLVTAMVVATALVGGNLFFLRRVNVLLEVTRRLADGDLGARTGLYYDQGEFGKLAHSFDKMAAALEQRTTQLEAAKRDLENEISGRKMSEEALRDSEKKFRQLFHNANDAIFLHEITEQGLPGQFIEVNDVACTRLGYGRDELLAMSPGDIDAPEYLGKIPVIAKELLEKGRVTFEMSHVSRDGARIPVEISAHVYKVNGKSVVLSIARDITERKRSALENARLYEEARRRIQQIQALRKIDMAITASLDLRVTFNVVLDQVTAQLGIDAAGILLINPHNQNLEYAAGRGFRSRAIERCRLRPGKGYAGRAVFERRVISIPNLLNEGSFLLRDPLLEGEDFISYYGVPLIAKGQVKGVLEIFHRAPLDPDPDWLEFLETLAGQAAIAIENAALFDGMQRSNVELTQAYDATIEGLSYAMDLRDKETEGHSQRVTEMTVRLARAMGIDEARLVHIRRGALLHDIGKMGVPDHVLLKPGPLTDEEWEIMRLHPLFAFEMLSPIEHLHPALDIPYCHHEKWDGTGYPRRLKGEQIPLSARIFAVVDVWDALRSERPYRPAWPEEKVREFIREQAGKHFDPRVVEVFMKMEV